MWNFNLRESITIIIVIGSVFFTTNFLLPFTYALFIVVKNNVNNSNHKLEPRTAELWVIIQIMLIGFYFSAAVLGFQYKLFGEFSYYLTIASLILTNAMNIGLKKKAEPLANIKIPYFLDIHKVNIEYGISEIFNENNSFTAQIKEADGEKVKSSAEDFINEFCGSGSLNVSEYREFIYIVSKIIFLEQEGSGSSNSDTLTSESWYYSITLTLASAIAEWEDANKLSKLLKEIVDFEIPFRNFVATLDKLQTQIEINADEHQIRPYFDIIKKIFIYSDYAEYDDKVRILSNLLPVFSTTRRLDNKYKKDNHATQYEREFFTILYSNFNRIFELILPYTKDVTDISLYRKTINELGQIYAPSLADKWKASFQNELDKNIDNSISNEVEE